MSIAPFQVHIIGLNHHQPEVSQACQKLYEDLKERHIDVLYDDRGEKAGFAFADADLIGCPLRVVISPKTLATGQVEFKRRDWGKRSEMIPADAILALLEQHIHDDLAILN